MEQSIFQRTELLLGEEMMNKLAQKRVIIFGIGGVGSWCAESLIRTGIQKLTIVDFDRICETNINRQLHATTQTTGQAKTEVLKKRLLEINPEAEITAIHEKYDDETSGSFRLDSYDYIIDAIDSLKSKIHLIRKATNTNAVFFSSMGAALKTDVSRIKTVEFWKVSGCPLAAALRKTMRKEKQFPGKKFLCVYSDELLKNQGKELPGKTPNGTVVHITASFGLRLTGLVIQHLINEK